MCGCRATSPPSDRQTDSTGVSNAEGMTEERKEGRTGEADELEADHVAGPQPQGLHHPVGQEDVVLRGTEVEVAGREEEEMGVDGDT